MLIVELKIASKFSKLANFTNSCHQYYLLPVYGIHPQYYLTVNTHSAFKLPLLPTYSLTESLL